MNSGQSPLARAIRRTHGRHRTEPRSSRSCIRRKSRIIAAIGIEVDGRTEACPSLQEPAIDFECHHKTSTADDGRHDGGSVRIPQIEPGSEREPDEQSKEDDEAVQPFRENVRDHPKWVAKLGLGDRLIAPEVGHKDACSTVQI